MLKRLQRLGVTDKGFNGRCCSNREFDEGKKSICSPALCNILVLSLGPH